MYVPTESMLIGSCFMPVDPFNGLLIGHFEVGITSKVLEHNSIGFKNFGGIISKVSENFT